MSRRFVPVCIALLAALAMGCSPKAEAPVEAPKKPAFKVAWSIYVGWMPWEYAGSSGILKKWADKYGIEIELTQINDYVESINQYTAGKYDACVMTNMDMLTIPSAGGVDSTAVILGDYSNGNDGVVLKGAGKKLVDIKGQSVNLVELSVSHYLLARGLASVGLKESDVKVVNTSDADIVAAYATPDVTATVTWKPLLSEVVASQGSSLVFDSSKTPGEILDLMVVNTKVLKEHPELGKALVGAWYETMAVMQAKDDAAAAALTSMAKASGTDLAGFNEQLATTNMYWQATDAVAAITSPDLLAKMDLVRSFSFEKGLLGAGAKTVDAVGIEFPGGKMLGNPQAVTMRFDASYMQLAAEGKL
ncbi:MAG: ABC transporter substrate-binding protein [Proteobacteria bacterium]|nr:ABC transporter substrate-binding protein [Pseudomonadota bacterium]MBK7114829.1 ABC transporter substrate-binding protein [Pseudomonadota bacterium]MCC6631470.1 ABC transporter substrate-binding protein [Gammaproteobacteria bacterium]